jgi:tetratricopeptide (TPR) repeat protein
MALVAIGGAVSTIQPAWGDVDRRDVPTVSYHVTMTPFYEGDYEDALDEFLAEGRGAIKTAQSRWIDSICYHTMSGECYYHMGELPQALEHYTSALKLFVAYSDWMIRVKFPPAIRASNSGSFKRIPWNPQTRQARLGSYPTSMLIGQGRINNNEQVRRGGVVQQAVLFPVQVQEIVRCTCLALRRRTELMGPACKHAQLTDQVVAALQQRPGPPNHWSEAWVDIQLGLALLAADKEPQALPYLKRSVLAAGEFYHPLSSTALLTLGKIALKKGDFQAALRLFEEATFTSVQYPDAGILEEAFRYGAMAHLLSNRKGLYAPLNTAERWARTKGLRQLQASLLLLGAENYAVLGQTRQAAGLLDEARSAVGRRQMRDGRVGARLNYLTALVAYQQRKLDLGNQSLAAAMRYMGGGSHWLFQINLADKLFASGSISDRAAMELYGQVLRDPQPSDWSYTPMESMAVLLAPHPVPFEHWFEVAMRRKEPESALEIADRARRHRFFSSLSFGGRLQSLRRILEAPLDSLDNQAQLQRQDLLVRFPAYKQLAEAAEEIRQQLRAMPPVAEESEQVAAQRKALSTLLDASALQEAALREIALRREPASLVFPPLRSTKEVQKSLPEGHVLMVFFATRRHVYGFLLNNERYTYWQVGSPSLLARRIVGLLREMGHFEQNRELTAEELADPQWKESAEDVLNMILEGSKADFSKSFKELIIVPDGLMWYVPFEALQVKADGRLTPLLFRFRMRYAPTMSLTVSTGRAHRPMGITGVAVGRLFPRDDEEVAQRAFEQLAQVAPGAVALPENLPGPSSVYATLFDRLIVLDDIRMNDTGPYQWAPIQNQRSKPGNALNDWLSLPHGGPEVVVLPGFHTATESALRKVTPETAGNELFLSVCGLMSSGVRTVLLSRWRSGGQTSFDLVREFVQELPHTTPADAWQRACLLTAAAPLDPEAEPRLRRSGDGQAPSAAHPFFWAGYMLIDPGIQPQSEPPGEGPPPDEEEPVVKFKQPAQPGANDAQ